MALDVQPNLNVSPLTVVPTSPQADPIGAGTATSAMIEAFRTGQLTAEEISDRAMRRPAVQAAVNMATDPQVIAAQKQAIIAGGSNAESQAELEKVKLAQAQWMAKIPPLSQHKVQALIAADVFPPTVSLQTWDANAQKTVDAAYEDLKAWHIDADRAKNLAASVKDEEFVRPNGDTVKGPREVGTMREASVAAVASIKQHVLDYGTNPKLWFAHGKPLVHSNVLKAPAPGQSIVGPIGLPQDSPMAPMETLTEDTPSVRPAVTVVPRVAGAAGISDVAVAAPSVDDAMVTKLAESAGKKAPTEVQTRALFARTMMDQANGVFDRLKNEKTFNPASWATMMYNVAGSLTFGLAEGFEPEALKSFNSAKFAWSEGFLRLQSGAAVPETEVRRYTKGLFPALGDTSQNKADKENMRAEITAMTRNIASGQAIDSAAYTKLHDRADSNASTVVAREKAAISRGMQTTFKGQSGYFVPGLLGPRFVPDEKKATVNRGLVVPKD